MNIRSRHKNNTNKQHINSTGQVRKTLNLSVDNLNYEVLRASKPRVRWECWALASHLYICYTSHTAKIIPDDKTLGCGGTSWELRIHLDFQMLL